MSVRAWHAEGLDDLDDFDDPVAQKPAEALRLAPPDDGRPSPMARRLLARTRELLVDAGVGRPPTPTAPPAVAPAAPFPRAWSARYLY